MILPAHNNRHGAFLLKHNRIHSLAATLIFTLAVVQPVDAASPQMLAAVTNQPDAQADSNEEVAATQALEKNPQDAQAIGELGLVRLRQGRHAEAKELFEHALTLDSANSSKWSSLVNTASYWKLIRESSAARDEKQLEVAEKNAREAIQIEPSNAEGWALLGGVLLDRGNEAEAEKWLRDALKSEPDNGSAIRGLTTLWSKQGKHTEALALLDSLGDEWLNASN